MAHSQIFMMTVVGLALLTGLLADVPETIKETAKKAMDEAGKKAGQVVGGAQDAFDDSQVCAQTKNIG